jgi:hypothetical protein
MSMKVQENSLKFFDGEEATRIPRIKMPRLVLYQVATLKIFNLKNKGCPNN